LRNTKLLRGLLLVFILIVFPRGAFIFAQEERTQYEIRGRFNEDIKVFTFNENVRFKNHYGEDLREIVFHLYPDSYNKIETMPAFSMGPISGEKEVLKEEQKGDIVIMSANANGAATNFTQDNQILKLKLDNPLKSDEEITIEMDFTLKIPLGNSRLGYYEEVYSLTNWYPILSIYDVNNDKWDENTYHPIGESNFSEVADYNVSLEIPPNMVIGSTGVEVMEQVDDRFRTVVVKAENVRDFVFIMSSRFKLMSKSILGIKVNNFYLDMGDKLTEVGAKEVLDITCDAVELFSNKFGKYPYEELDVVETFLGGGAMEYPQLIQMPVYSGISKGNYSNGRMSFIHEAAVHETGHQWWYVTVGNNEYMEPVLDESLTVFSTAYFFENKYGKYAPNGVYMTIRNRLFPGVTDSKAINLSVDKFNDLSEYFRTVYNRGGLIFEDLRERAGEEKFIKIMQGYFDTYKFKNASVNGLLEIIEAEAGEDTAKAIGDGMNSQSYYPKNIELNEEERQEIYKFQARQRIEEAEKEHGVILGSMALRAIKGEKVFLVKPLDLPVEQELMVEASINTIKENMKQQYGVDIVIKTDREITEDEKKEGNIILMGGLKTNSLIRDMNGKLPVLLTNSGILFDGMFIMNKNISGCFSAKNPYNSDKVLTIYYWKGNSNLPDVFYGMYETTEQFIFKIGSSKEIRGVFEQ
jgi:hypothetical protein